MGVKRKREQNGSAPTQQAAKTANTVFGEVARSSDNEEGSNSSAEDSDEEHGEMEVDDVEGVPGPSSQPSSGHGGRRPPTALELRGIKDAADLYRSSSFKLQIDALLPNVRPKYPNSAPLDRFLTSLHSCINSLSPQPPRHPLEASKDLLKKGITVPYVLPLPTQDTNWKVAFEKPSEIVVAGSWPNKLSVKAKDKQRFVVDLAVEIPSSLLQEKDYLNGRLFQKRAYYLSVIAAGITNKKSGLHVDATWTVPGGDPRSICLTVRPKAGTDNDLSKLNAEVRIIPVLGSSSPIPLQRISPAKSNIRTTDNSQDTPSPIYNHAIHVFTTPKPQLLRLHAIKNLVPSFADALCLLRIWANQRGYSKGSKLLVRGFEASGALWPAVLDLLISGEESSPGSSTKTTKRKPLGKGLSSYQLFRAALDLLARHDFCQEHIFVKSEKGHQFPPEDYAVGVPVFVDATGVNLLASVPRGSLEMLRHDARATLDSLSEDSVSRDPFKDTFLKDHRDMQTRFDVILRVDLSSAKLRVSSSHATLEHGSLYSSLMATFQTSVSQALGNRVRAVACLESPSEAMLLSETSASHSPVVFVGLILDVEHAFRLVDHGPSADDPDPDAAQRFHEFWGDKAELRRFKDGSIVESVVWDVKTSDERTKIPFYICRHILSLHCGIPSSDIQHWQDPFDATMRLPESITSVYQSAKAETGFKAALSAFDGLVKSIKALDNDLPLAVLNVSPISEGLRYTSVFTPTAIPTSAATALPECARYMQPMAIVIEFEKSGRWPDDLRAIQKVKLAMFERLASKLMETTPGLKASVVVGDPVHTSDIMDTASLEIVTPQGWTFSASICHDREAALLDTTIDDRPHIPAHIKKNLPGGPDPRVRHATQEAKDVYVRRFIHSPRHHRVIAALCHRCTAYAGTVRLVKRWLASHWILQKYLSIEAAELLCAAVFLGTARKPRQSAHAPATKERGFAQVVELIKDWKWEEGIFVPLYSEDQSGSDEQATPHTGSSAGGVWKISTEFDPDGFMWTCDAPEAVMARRIQTIASATWGQLQALDSNDLDVSRIFSHPTHQYDFLVDLHPPLLPRYYQNIHADPSVWARKRKYANALEEQRSSPVQPGYDPASLLFNDLSRVYKDTFMLFHDPFGGACFGGVWDPRLKEPRPFKILAKYSSTPAPKESSKDKTSVVLNQDAILTEVERFGAGLITTITRRVAPP